MVQTSVSLQEQAYQYIRKKLIAGEWGDGEFLVPSKVAKEIGISYTPVREAIIQLVAEGVLQQMPKAGVCVRSLNRDDLQELFEMREILESGAVRLAVARMSPQRLAQLQEICDEHANVIRELRDCKDKPAEEALTGKIREIDISFHLNLIAATENKKMVKTMSDLHVVSCIFQRRLDLVADDLFRHLMKVCAFHRCIMNAIQKRDAVAADRRMRRHIAWAKKYHLALCDRELNKDAFTHGF